MQLSTVTAAAILFSAAMTELVIGIGVLVFLPSTLPVTICAFFFLSQALAQGCALLVGAPIQKLLLHELRTPQEHHCLTISAAIASFVICVISSELLRDISLQSFRPSTGEILAISSAAALQAFGLAFVAREMNEGYIKRIAARTVISAFVFVTAVVACALFIPDQIVIALPFRFIVFVPLILLEIPRVRGISIRSISRYLSKGDVILFGTYGISKTNPFVLRYLAEAFGPSAVIAVTAFQQIGGGIAAIGDRVFVTLLAKNRSKSVQSQKRFNKVTIATFAVACLSALLAVQVTLFGSMDIHFANTCVAITERLPSILSRWIQERLCEYGYIVVLACCFAAIAATSGIVSMGFYKRGEIAVINGLALLFGIFVVIKWGVARAPMTSFKHLLLTEILYYFMAISIMCLAAWALASHRTR